MSDQPPESGRTVPVPVSISPEAQRVLATPAKQLDLGPDPALTDAEGWLRYIRARELPIREAFRSRVPPEGVLTRSELDTGGFTTFVLRPTHLRSDGAAPLVVEVHGGALISCGGELAWWTAAPRAALREAVTWVPDYRMPPLHPYPVPLDDVLSTYRKALEVRPPERVIVHGESAGGNLAAALMLRLKEEGLPMPAALVLLTPELDLTESGDTFATLLGLDVMGLLRGPNLLYANGHDLSDPHLSPLFGDVSGFPPTFLQSGTRDLFLSNAVRMHRKLLNAGVEVELRVMEAARHTGFGGSTPEDIELRTDALAFERTHVDRYASSRMGRS